jgi:alpha-glucosidase
MNVTSAGPRWWQGATMYQIYVRSWRDTDGDGYGDLGGVIGGLDYLKWLGIDAIWLSPTMPSPDQDWGYDVSDYVGVHPQLGTMADMDKLIAEAGDRGIAVLLDLVPNHTSDAHPWFIDALSARDSAHRDYYVWADPAAGGGPPSAGPGPAAPPSAGPGPAAPPSASPDPAAPPSAGPGPAAPPNNWVDAIGASAWTFDDATGQYYLHNFLPGQPDLNWWEPRVHAEFQEVLRFWFGRGVAGFRIDVAHGLYKDALLRDNPPLVGGGRLEGSFGQRPIYSQNRPETHGVYRDWRRIADRYAPPRLLLGETWVGDLARLASYYGDDDELDLAFNFPFLFARFDAGDLAGVVERTLAALPAGACPVWTASNHDVSRFPSRWCGDDERKARLALLVLATLPGATVLYYGDEIAMTDATVPAALRRDHMTPGVGTGGRDAARTPMQWDGSPTAGFTAEGVTPWLPYGDNTHRNVAGQRDDPGSTLNLCRNLLALRRAEFAGRLVAYERLPAPPGAWVYRSGPLLVAANFSTETVALDGTAGEVLLTTAGREVRERDAELWLQPWQGMVMRAP